MDDSAYRTMVSRFGEGSRDGLAELEAAARQREDRSVLAAIELRRGPSAKEARAAGDLLALGRAIAGRAGLWHTWNPLVEEVSRWPDDDAARAAVASLARALDALELDDLREAPPAWWNAAQRGAAPVGWPLVRRLIFRDRQDPEALSPCAAPESLEQLTIIDADERNLAPDQLAGARRVRTLSYEFSASIERAADPIESLAVLGTLQQLELTVRRAATDLSALRALSALADLSVHFKLDDLAARDPLAALGGTRLSALRVSSRSALPSLAVLDQLPALRLLYIDRAPADTAPIGRLSDLEDLLLGHAATLPSLPASLRILHLIESGGLRSADPLQPLTKLEILRLTDCRAVRELHLASLSALRELSITGASPGAADGASALELIDLGEAAHLEELRLDGLPALREVRFSGPRPASLRLVSLERCPALAVPPALASSAG